MSNGNVAMSASSPGALMLLRARIAFACTMRDVAISLRLPRASRVILRCTRKSISWMIRWNRIDFHLFILIIMVCCTHWLVIYPGRLLIDMETFVKKLPYFPLYIKNSNLIFRDMGITIITYLDNFSTTSVWYNIIKFVISSLVIL